MKLLRYAIAYDIGRAVNPMIVDGQLVGALAQGIGGALLEELVYDEQGQLLTTTFMDYLDPDRHGDAGRRPPIRILEETPTPLNPLGVKGAGEGGSSGCGGAIANAVADALAPLGVTITALPLSPDRVLALIRAARTGGPLCMPEELMAPRYVGASVRRTEDPPLLMGQAHFIGDLRLPGLLAVAFLRSPHAHARHRRDRRARRRRRCRAWRRW